MTTHTLYIDEAGNAGINYLDEEQPFHVAAGILVPNEASDVLRDIIRRACGQSPEMKAAKRLGSHRGRRVIAEVLQGLGAGRAVSFFGVMERKFSLVGRLVEVFLDPDHHDAAAWLPNHALRQRRELTEELYDELPMDVLRDFALAYRAPSASAFSEVLDRTIAHLDGSFDPRVVAGFRGARGVVSEIVERETHGDAYGKHSTWASLNLPALGHLLRMVDRCLASRGVRCTVVHDRNPEFEKLFMHWIPALSQPSHREPEVRLPDGTLYRGVLTHCDGFVMEDSKNEPLLQAADIVASTVSRIAREALRAPSSCDQTFASLAKLTMPALMITDEQDNPTVAGAYAHSRVTAAMISVALRGGAE